MINLIYIEREVVDHPRVKAICARFPNAAQVRCDRYTEVFNPKAQSFRLQKRRPALVLARKHDRYVLPTPAGYGIGGAHNFYFSHMLNCVYDCRYCFLQGMYRSAHYVLFVNYEDFETAIEHILVENHGQPTWMFSGYDCDSLALEPVTGFGAFFLPIFARHANGFMELRTKSTQVRTLLDRDAITNVVVAFSLTSAPASRALEHKVPALDRRIDAMVRLQRAGWKLGLRFDPLIYQEDYRAHYRQLFELVFARVRPAAIHSVTLGPFRLPRDYFKTIVRHYPDEPLFAGPLEEVDGMMSYRRQLERDMIGYCTATLRDYVPESKFFPHSVFV